MKSIRSLKDIPYIGKSIKSLKDIPYIVQSSLNENTKNKLPDTNNIFPIPKTSSHMVHFLAYNSQASNCTGIQKYTWHTYLAVQLSV